MNACYSVPFKGSKLFSAVLIGSLFVGVPASAEKLYSKLTEEDAKSLSSPLKTFICLGDRLTPDWCDAFRKSKLQVRTPPKPALTEAETASIKAAAKAAEAPALSAAAKAALAAASAWDDMSDLLEVPEEVKVAVVEKISPEEVKRKKDWEIFTGEADISRLMAKDLKVLEELAATNEYPEANEILGFAYSAGSGVVRKSKVKAYRQYGIAYLKGLVRVKPNMDVLWKQFTKSEQFALVHEFNALRKEMGNISTSMNESN